MKSIISLSKLIDLKNDYPNRVISNQEDLAGVLFNAIINGEVENNEDIKQIWGGVSPKNGVKRVKTVLEERLINSILSDRAGAVNLKEAYQYIYKRISAAKILQAKGKYMTVAEILEPTFKIASKFEFTECIFQIAKELKYFYSLNVDKKKYNYYNNKYKEFSGIYQLECELESYYTDILVRINGKISYSKEDLEFVGQTIAVINQIPKKSSLIIALQAFINIFYAKMNDRELDVISICEKTTSLFLNKPSKTPQSYIFTILYYSVPIYIKQGNFERCEEILAKCESFANREGFNWIRLQQFKAILLFYQLDWKRAKDLCETVLKRKSVNLEQRELWSVYLAYSCLFLGDQIKSSKIINDIHTFLNDKRGMYFHAIILQLISYISRKKFGTFIDKSPSFESYLYRHLNTRTTRRQWFFSKAILGLEKASFKKENVEKHCQPWIDKMNQYPMSSNFELEFIPYNIIWEKVVGWLE